MKNPTNKMQKLLSNVRASKSFDNEKGMWRVSYSEGYVHSDSKEIWNSESTDTFLFQNEPVADTKKQELDLVKVARQSGIK